MIVSPFGRVAEKAPRWDLVDTESYGGGIRVLAPYLIVWGTWVYIGGKSTSVEQQGAHEGGGRAWGGVGAPPTSWLPGSFLYVGSKSSGSRSFRKSRSQRFHSIWTPFDILFLRNTEIGKKNSNLGWASG